MELTLQVDGTQLSDDVRDLLDNLTPEQKRDMAMQLLKDSMHDVESRFNKRVGVEEALAEMSNERVLYRYCKGRYGGQMELQRRYQGDDTVSAYERDWREADRSDQQRFDRLTRFYSHPLTYFRETILGEMLRVGRERVEQEVGDSELVQNAINEAVKGVVANLPGMVMAVMESLFAKQMVDALEQHSITAQYAERQENAVKELGERLDRANLY